MPLAKLAMDTDLNKFCSALYFIVALQVRSLRGTRLLRGVPRSSLVLPIVDEQPRPPRGCCSFLEYYLGFIEVQHHYNRILQHAALLSALPLAGHAN